MKLLEKMDIISGFVPVDMQTGANNGDWVSLKNYHRCLVVLFKAAGTAGDNPTITLKQATDVAGAGSKNAAIIAEVYQKQGTLTGVGQWTRVTQAAAATYVDTASAENQGVYAIDVDTADLDVAGGFDCIQVSVADVGVNAQLGCAFYMPYMARYGQQIPDSAIVD